MWESIENITSSVNMDLVPVGSTKSAKHLNKVAEAARRNGLPMGIVLPMYSKRKRLAAELDDACTSCGLDFKLENSFTLYLRTGNKYINAELCRYDINSDCCEYKPVSVSYTNKCRKGPKSCQSTKFKEERKEKKRLCPPTSLTRRRNRIGQESQRIFE